MNNIKRVPDNITVFLNNLLRARALYNTIIVFASLNLLTMSFIYIFIVYI